MKLRPLESTDVGGASRLADAARVEGWSPAAIAATAETPHGRAWVATDGDRLLGFALARFVADEAELLLIAVDAAARRGGVGRALWGEVAAGAQAQGASVVHLEVASDNPGALAFYGALGFEPSGRRAGYYASGADAILMSRAL